MLRPLTAVWLGRQPYDAVYQLQCALMDRVKAGETPDTVLLLEHDATITLGRGAQLSNLLASTEALANRGVLLHKTDRGGDVTLHAPGQLVAYPIVNLAPQQKDVRRYVNALVGAMSDIVDAFGVSSGQIPDLVGLWTDLANPTAFPTAGAPQVPAKLGAIGVRISRWVTMHGFALNLTTEMDLFRLIVPCGIREHGVASVESVTGSRPDCAETARRAHPILCQRLERSVGRFIDFTAKEALPADELGRTLAAARLEATPKA